MRSYVGKTAALLWLAVVLTAGGYLGFRIHQGLSFHTDLMSLLPREDQNPDLQHSKDVVAQNLARRFMVLVGAPDRDTARAAVLQFIKDLSASPRFKITTAKSASDDFQRVGVLYYPYRASLLSEEDRASLLKGQGHEVADRALAKAFGVVGFANAKLLQNDPFLLLPDFFMGWPQTGSRLAPDDGLLGVNDANKNWFYLISGEVSGDMLSLDAQKQTVDAFEHTVDGLRAAHASVTVLRFGSFFFAQAAAAQGLHESSLIGILSTLGVVVLIVGMFRAARPVWLSLLVIAAGVLVAFASTLMLFGAIHVGVLLFGVSLIGVAVDYSLQYFSEVFVPETAPPMQRLRRVFAGVTLGAATTIIGYLTLFLAPFPGLHQVAAFSAIGLIGAWLTVALWLPYLDLRRPRVRGERIIPIILRVLRFWEARRYRHWRHALTVLLLASAAIGACRWHADDDVHHMQDLPAGLVIQQQKINDLTGADTEGGVLLVHAPDVETALQREEVLADRLQPLIAQRVIDGFQSPAQFIPSAARQKENRALQMRELYQPLLAAQGRKLHLSEMPVAPAADSHILTPDIVMGAGGALSAISLLLPASDGEGVVHIVRLLHLTQPELVKQAIADLPGVYYVDPAGDFSVLLGKYRQRALGLLAISAALMLPLLLWRYGPRRGMVVALPPVMAVILTPALRALVGGSFTFFDAMGLVLILSIGMDYAVFCAETTVPRKPVTMLAVTMAACTALISFGLLAFSSVHAVHNFGLTMMIGILLSLIFAPLALPKEGAI